MKYLAIDNETYLITRENPAPKVVCTSAYSEDFAEPELVIHPQLLDFWKAILTDDNLTLVGLNIAYDTSTIAATYPELLPLIFEKYRKKLIADVGIRQELWDISRGQKQKYAYSLYALVKLIFGEQMKGKKGDDIWRLRYSELDGIPLDQWPEEALAYAKNDALWTWKVWDAQLEADADIRYDRQRAYTNFALRLMECRGMVTDPVAVAKCRAHHEKIIRDLQPELIKEGLIEVKKDGKTTKKVAPARRRVIEGCQRQGIDPPLTKTGLKAAKANPGFHWSMWPKYVATDTVAVFYSQDPLLKKRELYAGAEKILSTYVPVLEEGTKGPITTRYGIANTGRTTSSSPSKPLVGSNLQNAPRKGGVRECYVPRPGCVYLAGDFSGAELHTLAQTNLEKIGYSVMGDQLKAGKDLHLYVGAHLLGISYDEALERFKSGDKEVKKARQDAKPANFGFGGFMFERTFIVTQIKDAERLWEFDDVRNLRQTWLKAFPEMQEYFDLCRQELGPYQETVIEFPVTGMLKYVKGLNTICNSYFQARAAAGALRALCEVSRRCYAVRDSALYGARPCTFIHDENILEIPEDRVRNHEAAMEMKQVMEDEFNIFTPDYPVEVEPVLMRRWSKAAEPVFDEEGILIPWTS